ncbi:MAG: hypothetical protein JWQ81_7951 [Amycolatopsis sp.]|jgi:hypothetical protein|uniref:hypothetical protein n=1 Tax=Amycolatopsis sp. TaxID=37632 RepID=UPI002610CA27|nr:hypothetical protein [Amycolatopsis sp.]MCU1687212.1 hypothetical protein [Amycolatopsis sp.]
MDLWGYPHELEYRREERKGFREHEYTELVDDMGFVFEHRSELWKNWTVRYTTACAQDFLQRKHAPRGTFVVSLYRLFPGERRHVVTIRLKWPGKVVRGQTSVRLDDEKVPFSSSSPDRRTS